MLYRQAAGCIIYTLDDHKQPYYLLLHYQAGHWDFAKGHTAQGELLLDTAQREVFEETGLLLTINDDVKYTYRYKIIDAHQQNIYKTVSLFVAKSSTQSIYLSSEHSNYSWLMLDQALKQLTYKNAQEALKRAHHSITQHFLLAID